MSFAERVVSTVLYPASNLISRAVMKAWGSVSDELPQFVFHEVPQRLAPQHIAPGATVYADRETMLAMLPKGTVGAEIGTYRGVFARLLLDVAQPKKLYLLDRSFDLVPEGRLSADIERGVVELRVGDSSSSMQSFPEHFFDWIYVDGDHRHAGVAKDVAASDRALKPGGLMMFNDYMIFDPASASPFGVIHAANALCVDRGYQVVAFALHRDGYPDILLRKPA